MPGHSLIGSVATLESSSVTWPENPGSMKPAVEWVSRPSRPSERLALEPRGDVVGQRDELEGRPEHELAGVQDERLVRRRSLDQVGEVGLVFGRVDERVLVVVEQPEVAIEPHIDARRLHHLGFPRLEPDAARVDLGPDVAVGEQHAASLASAGERMPGRRGAFVMLAGRRISIRRAQLGTR